MVRLTNYFTCKIISDSLLALKSDGASLVEVERLMNRLISLMVVLFTYGFAFCR